MLLIFGLPYSHSRENFLSVFLIVFFAPLFYVFGVCILPSLIVIAPTIFTGIPVIRFAALTLNFWERIKALLLAAFVADLFRHKVSLFSTMDDEAGH